MSTGVLENRLHEAVAAGTVHVVDDDDGLRAALVRLIRSAGMTASGHANAFELRQALRFDTPSCIILDIRLEREDGLSVQEGLRVDGSTTPVIFLTGFGTIPMTVQAMRCGAAEFLTKPVDDTILLSAVRRALELHATMLERRRSTDRLSDQFGSLTDRERQVMTLTIGGLMNKQIAGELGTTEITAKVHKRRVMTKMGARSLPDLVRIAETLGIEAIRKR